MQTRVDPVVNGWPTFDLVHLLKVSKALHLYVTTTFSQAGWEAIMSATPQQVLDFLKTSAPFDVLADDALQELAKHARLIYLAAENQNQLLQENADRLFLIQSGQFSVKDSDGPERHLS
ncbi:MAG: hypothetical protein GY938_13780, partial [Ketobacter sp.]|nr:hypothetical protein [Ketobacter sp.]